MPLFARPRRDGSATKWSRLMITWPLAVVPPTRPSRVAKTRDFSGAAWTVIPLVAALSVGWTRTSPTHGLAPVGGATTMMRSWTRSLAPGSAVGVPALAGVHSDHLSFTESPYVDLRGRAVRRTGGVVDDDGDVAVREADRSRGCRCRSAA